jgi:hypothetical protein
VIEEERIVLQSLRHESNPKVEGKSSDQKLELEAQEKDV